MERKLREAYSVRKVAGGYLVVDSTGEPASRKFDAELPVGMSITLGTPDEPYPSKADAFKELADLTRLRALYEDAEDRLAKIAPDLLAQHSSCTREEVARIVQEVIETHGEDPFGLSHLIPPSRWLHSRSDSARRLSRAPRVTA